MKLNVNSPIEPDIPEILRYLRSKPEETLISDIETVYKELSAKFNPAAAAAVFPIKRKNGSLFCGETVLPGQAVSARMSGCERCVSLAVTLGFETDRLISALGQTSPYRAMIADACATAAVETLADRATALCRDIFCRDSMITHRFSPGYGDLPLDIQQTLLDMVDARRLLGLTVSRSCLLSPIKSVTAFIGIAEGDCRDSTLPHGCESCFMQKTCPYRKSPTKG